MREAFANKYVKLLLLLVEKFSNKNINKRHSTHNCELISGLAGRRFQ